MQRGVRQPSKTSTEIISDINRNQARSNRRLLVTMIIALVVVLGFQI